MKLIYGVGDNKSTFPKREVRNGIERNTKEYQMWIDMLRRCYSPKEKLRKPTYINCEVSEDFKYFHKFMEWITLQNRLSVTTGHDLDKDLKVKGNKLYSADTCLLVPSEINKLITNRKSKRNICIGVTKCGNKFRAMYSDGVVNKHLGLFYSVDEAFLSYKYAKEAHIRYIADQYKSKISEELYSVLVNFEIERFD